MPDFSLTEITGLLAAAGALGTAAMGLVDTTKVFGGGPSNIGFGYVAGDLDAFLSPLANNPAAFGKAQVLQTLRANWLNGVAKADQKAKAKSLIHLGLTRGSAQALANAAGVDAATLQSLAEKTAAGEAVTQDEINVLGQFDVVLSAVLDAAYERGDQKYRNAAKFFVPGQNFWVLQNFWLSLLLGFVATPLAPVAKDLATGLQTAVSAVSALKR
jgi:hypothetical protein